MSLIGWPRIPVPPGRSRTDRRTCGGRESAADLPADTDPWHQRRTGDIRSKSPRDYGDPVKVAWPHRSQVNLPVMRGRPRRGGAAVRSVIAQPCLCYRYHVRINLTERDGIDGCNDDKGLSAAAEDVTQRCDELSQTRSGHWMTTQ